MTLASLALPCLALCAAVAPAFAADAPLANQSSAPKPLSGAFEVAGARLGMSPQLALQAMAATKPQWARAIAEQSATVASDCQAHGRAAINLAFAAGSPSARMEASCPPGADGKPSMARFELKIRQGLTDSASAARSALAERYGQPSSSQDLAAGSFELAWIADPSDPSAHPGERLLARFDARAFDAAPLSLTIVLESRPVRPASAAPNLPF